jgi:hypothetical protein
MPDSSAYDPIESDDPIEVQNRALYKKLQANVVPGFTSTLPFPLLNAPTPAGTKNRFIIGSMPLPSNWLDQTIRLPTLEAARPFFRLMKGHHVTIAFVRQILERLDGHHARETEDETLDRLATTIISGRLWMMPRELAVPIDVLKTSPSVYDTLNANYGTNLDIARLSEWEGGQHLRAYVPFTTYTDDAGEKHTVVAGSSGMTIATGFDLGQQTPARLRTVTGLSNAALEKILPFASPLNFKNCSTEDVLAKVALIAPVPIIDHKDADALDGAAAEDTLQGTLADWALAVNTNPKLPEFGDLPSPWQTVMFSRTYNQGAGWIRGPHVSHHTRHRGSPTYGFFAAAAEGRWQDAVTALRNAPGPGWFKTRVSWEAAYLLTQMPDPIK